MRERLRKRGAALAAGAAAMALGLPLLAVDHPGSRQDFAIIERGRYLTVAADCAACHSDPHQGAAFAGGRAIETPFGTVLAANITPDQDTGIGAWTDEQFDAAVRQGRLPDGKRLYPAMPYPYYTKMTREDVLAIRAYLNTITPAHNDVDSNQLPFPFNVRSAMWFWDALYFNSGAFNADPAQSAVWNRGAYLVEATGHCGTCHTPKTFLGGDQDRRQFEGYSIQGWFAPNITNDDARGLGRWSNADIAEFLKKGHNRIAGASGPMGEEVADSSSRLTQEDLNAIATYLKARPGQTLAARAAAVSDPMMVAGAAIYQDRCSACHSGNGHGVPYLIPDLAASSAVVAREPTTLIRVVLRGAQTVATQDEPTGPAMPAFGWQLSDTQVAAVATYIRNSWGHAGPALSAGEVRRARESLAARND
jgi:mono/diheme cytochrome c family protein